MILLLDNYDSFTYILYDYLIQLGAECKVCRNDRVTLSAIDKWKPIGIVISPGPGTPEKAGISMECIDRFHQKIPILGICLGHQALGLYFGAWLVKASQPVHGKTSMITHNRKGLFEGLPNPFEVMRYHSLVLVQVEETTLEVAARGPEGEIMAIAHPQLPLAGLQFHPESILTQQGKQILSNWIKMVHNIC